MLRRNKFTDNQFEQKSDAFNLSISDLMAGILAIFILALSYFILNFGQANAQLTQNAEKREKLLQEIKYEMKNKHNINVTIFEKEGILRLPDGILFEKGEIEPNEGGKRVIVKLREILYKTLTSVKYKDAIETIFIEGHTDNTPVSKNNPKYKTNWELSAKRAIATWTLLGELKETEDENVKEENKTERNKKTLANLVNKNGERIFLFRICGYEKNQGK